ncbi:MAG: phosphoglycolate phosphatase [Ectothiorhodospiraceae bacterium]|jgi:phosphoglycolate phosphatase
MIPRRPGAVLFDLDGTLVDSAPDLAQAVNAMLRALDRETAAEDDVRAWVGNGARRLVMRALTGSFDEEPETVLLNRALALFFDFYAEHLCERSALYPGVRDCLETLASDRVPLAVVTNKPTRFTGPLLAALGVEGYFHALVSGDTLTVKKPDPAPLRHAANLCKVDAERCVMVGDSMADLRAAREANMPMVCVSYGYHLGGDVFDAGPDLVVDNLSGLFGNDDSTDAQQGYR